MDEFISRRVPSLTANNERKSRHESRGADCILNELYWHVLSSTIMLQSMGWMKINCPINPLRTASQDPSVVATGTIRCRVRMGVGIFCFHIIILILRTIFSRDVFHTTSEVCIVIIGPYRSVDDRQAGQ